MKQNRPLRRIVLATATTVTGMVMLLALKPHTTADTSAAPAPASTTAPSSGPTASDGTGEPSGGSSEPSSGSSGSSSGGSGSSDGGSGSSTGKKTITGDSVDTVWGPVQVRITVDNGKLTGVTALVYPQANQFETSLNQSALPQLEQEALAAQSSDIDTVSGATYTSEGYRQSLQSALDSAGL